MSEQQTGEGRIRVCVETGSKRTFACAIDWPGWSRSGRDEASALATLAAYGERDASAVGAVAPGFVVPESVASFAAVERLPGGSGTDFGVPSAACTADATPLGFPEVERQIELLRAAWSAFDTAVHAAAGRELRKGPRGGGRDLDQLVAHILEAENAYLVELGGKRVQSTTPDPWATIAEVREAAIQLLRSRAAGDEPVRGPRRKRPFWTLRYFVRRSAWHALDHAWEIEDRSH